MLVSNLLSKELYSVMLRISNRSVNVKVVSARKSLMLKTSTPPDRTSENRLVVTLICDDRRGMGRRLANSLALEARPRYGLAGS